MCYQGRGGAKDMEETKTPGYGEEAETAEEGWSADEDWHFGCVSLFLTREIY